MGLRVLYRLAADLIFLLPTIPLAVSCNSEGAPSPLLSNEGHPLPLLHVEADHIKDPSDRVVLLRGVNVPGNYTYPFAYSEKDLDCIRFFGFNFIRLGISWANAEPIEGIFDMEYIESYRDFIRKAADRGIYCMLEVHQVNWCIQGGAVPDWMCEQRPENPMDIFRILKEADRFWTSDALRSKLIRFWQFLVSNLMDLDGLFGYNILNEPLSTLGLCYGVFEKGYLFPFYRDIIAALRQIDPARPIILEPNAFSPILPNYTEPFPFENLLYSPHPYFLHMYDAQGRLVVIMHETPRSVREKYARYAEEADRMKVPFLAGEFGAPCEGYDFASAWLKESLKLQDEYLIGSAVWTYLPGDVNWSIVDMNGQPRAFYVEHHRRAYPRSTAGTPVLLESVPWEGRFRFAYQDSAKGGLTEIFFPLEMFQHGELDIQGASVWKYQADKELLVIQGEGRGKEVWISLELSVN